MEVYLLPKAYCPETRQSVKTQDLTGARYNLKQRAFAEEAAQRLADNMIARTRREWVPLVVEYTPTYRKES